MRTMIKALLAIGVAALAFAGLAGAAGPLPPGATSYPWVQPPAWVGTGTVGPALTATGQPWVQPPAGIPVAPVERTATVPGSGYQWVQPPAWVGSGKVGPPLTIVGDPSAQPPAPIPTA